MIIVNRISQNEGKGVHCIMYNLVPDPDLQGEGGGRDGLKEIFFQPFGPQFGLKIRGRGGLP